MISFEIYEKLGGENDDVSREVERKVTFQQTITKKKIVEVPTFYGSGL